MNIEQYLAGVVDDLEERIDYEDPEKTVIFRGTVYHENTTPIEAWHLMKMIHYFLTRNWSAFEFKDQGYIRSKLDIAAQLWGLEKVEDYIETLLEP